MGLADQGDIAGALESFRRDAKAEYAPMLELDDDAMMDEFIRPIPAQERAIFTPQMRSVWADDLLNKSR